MELITQFLKLMSDPVRLKILLALNEKSLCVCELVSLLEEPQPKISKHLIKFKDLGLVHSNRQEKFIYYTISLTNDVFVDLLNVVLTHHTPEFDKIKQRIHANEPIVCSKGL